MSRSNSRHNSGNSDTSSPKPPRFVRNINYRQPIPSENDNIHNVLLYIDNSNIFESARKHSARKKNYFGGIVDVACRIDVGKLVTRALEKRKLLAGRLYGSEPPALDSVWEAIRKKHIQVKTFERSKWTLKEKEIDASLTADAVEDIVLNRDVPGEKTVILFSGDRDLLCVAEKAFYLGYCVEIWSFKSSMNKAVLREAEKLNGEVQINYIDNIFDQITFTCMYWGNARIPVERSLIASLTLPTDCDKRKVFKSFVEKSGEIFRLPMMGKYIDEYHHLVLIPCVTEIYTPSASQSKTNPEKCSERKYSFYEHIQPHIGSFQDYFKEICASIQTWKEFLERRDDSTNENVSYPTRFDALRINDSESENEDDEGADLDSTEIGNRVMLDNDFYDIHHVDITDENEDFVPVIRKAKRKECMFSEPCSMKFACKSGNRCRYKHTAEEKEFFKSNPKLEQRKLYKTKACYKINCKYTNKSYMCPYAHSLEESRCLCCKQRGNGQHWMDQCPENKK